MRYKEGRLCKKGVLHLLPVLMVGAYGVTFRVAVFVLKPTALMVAVVETPTTKVFMVTVLVCWPAAKLMEATAGLATAGRVLLILTVSETTAGYASFTVAVEAIPPITEVGSRVMLRIDMGFTVRVACLVSAP